MCYTLSLLPAIFLIAPYSFIASHEFHETLIYFILPCALIAFVLGCRKHGDKKVAIMGTIGIVLLASAVILHETFHSDQHSDSLMTRPSYCCGQRGFDILTHAK